MQVVVVVVGWGGFKDFMVCVKEINGPRLYLLLMKLGLGDAEASSLCLIPLVKV